MTVFKAKITHFALRAHYLTFINTRHTPTFVTEITESRGVHTFIWSSYTWNRRQTAKRMDDLETD